MSFHPSLRVVLEDQQPKEARQQKVEFGMRGSTCSADCSADCSPPAHPKSVDPGGRDSAEHKSRQMAFGGELLKHGGPRDG